MQGLLMYKVGSYEFFSQFMAFTSENIKVFLAVLDRGSFSAAARALGRVPSAVSLVISQLEAELDVPLFDRGSREPRPTAAARALEPRARHLASQLRQLDADALALHRGLERRLTLAVAPELLSDRWTVPLATLAREFPSLEVEIISAPQTDALRLLHAGRADLALVFERERVDEREGFEEVGSDTMIAVLAPGLLAPGRSAHTLRLEDMLDLRQIAMTGRHSEQPNLQPDLQPNSQPDSQPNSRFILARQIWRTDSQLATLRLVQAGLGWALLPRTLVEPLVAAGQLLEVGFQNASNQVRQLVDIVWSRERPMGLGARRYVELIQQAWRA